MAAGLREIVPQGGRIFAIGDLHGCVSETSVLLNYLVQQAHLTPQDIVLFIGDFIDRGDSSAQVIQLLIEFRAQFLNCVFLRGNHEDMLLDFLGFEGGSRGQVYINNGGEKFFASYGVNPPYSAEDILAKIPREHVDFILGLDHYVVIGEYLFAHAGVNPLRDVYSQVAADLFWIRDEFIQNIHHLEKTVVFGHTPYQDAMFHLPYKIGIDTGLVYGNMLTCLELPSMSLYQVKSGSSQVLVTSFEVYKAKRKKT